MSKKYKSSEFYLQRMIEACAKIQEYIKRTDKTEFAAQKEFYDAVCMQFSHLGEQVSNLQESPERIIQHFPDDVDWASLKGLRNQIDHNYIAIDPVKIWDFANQEVADLESSLKRILKKRFGK